MLVQEITPFAFNNQFQEPKTANRIPFGMDSDVDLVKLKTNQDVKRSLDSTYETRPSDFRIKPICYGMNGGRPSFASASGAAAAAAPASASIVDHRFVDVDNFRAKESCKHSTNGQTTQTASESIRKLFNEFIADFNTSIERYCC